MGQQLGFYLEEQKKVTTRLEHVRNQREEALKMKEQEGEKHVWDNKKLKETVHDLKLEVKGLKEQIATVE